MKLSELQKIAHEIAVSKGWWDGDRNPLELIALMHSELSEAVEEIRAPLACIEQVYLDHDKPCGVPSELADCVIRIMDFCGRYGIDLEKAIVEKMEYNKTRPHRHGGKTA